MPLNTLEKVILVEQFHNKYIVIGIQAMDSARGDMHHAHSIVVKLGEGSAHFDIDGMLENLSSSGQHELADIFYLRYSLWSAMDVVFENRKLNQILQTLTYYLVRLPVIPTAAPHNGVPPLGVSLAIASGSGAQANNSRSTARSIGRTTLRVQNRVTTETTKLAPKRRRSYTGAGSSGSGLIHVDTQGRGDVEEVLELEKFTATQKESGTHVPCPFCSGCKHSQFISHSAR